MFATLDKYSLYTCSSWTDRVIRSCRSAAQAREGRGENGSSNTLLFLTCLSAAWSLILGPRLYAHSYQCWINFKGNLWCTWFLIQLWNMDAEDCICELPNPSASERYHGKGRSISQILEDTTTWILCINSPHARWSLLQNRLPLLLFS